MMGKNGDQIQRLFASPAEVFFVQYETKSKIALWLSWSSLPRLKRH